MAENPAARDRAWAAILKAGANGERFRVETVNRQMDLENRPCEETIRRALRAGTELGIIKHQDSSEYYELSEDAHARA